MISKDRREQGAKVSQVHAAVAKHKAPTIILQYQCSPSRGTEAFFLQILLFVKKSVCYRRQPCSDVSFSHNSIRTERHQRPTQSIFPVSLLINSTNIA